MDRTIARGRAGQVRKDRALSIMHRHRPNSPVSAEAKPLVTKIEQLANVHSKRHRLKQRLKTRLLVKRARTQLSKKRWPPSSSKCATRWTVQCATQSNQEKKNSFVLVSLVFHLGIKQ